MPHKKSPGIGFAFRCGLSRYLIWLTDDISGEKESFGTISAIVDGETKNVDVALIDGRYAILLNATCGITSLGEHSVKLTAGQAMGKYQAAEDVTIYTHADGSVDLTAPGADPIGITRLETAHSGHTGSAYEVLLRLSDPTFLAEGEQQLDVLVDGEAAAVTLKPGEAGTALLSCGEAVTLGKHTVTLPAGTELGSRVLDKVFSFCTYANGTAGEKERGEITLTNATAMLGGSYGDGLYYDLYGTVLGANWLINAVKTDGDITFSYRVNIDSKNNDKMFYGIARMQNPSWSYPQIGSVLKIAAWNTFANSFGLTDVAIRYDAQAHIAYYQDKTGNWVEIPGGSEVFHSEWNIYFPEDPLTTVDFAGIDEKGAAHFGFGWNGEVSNTTYIIDWTKVMVRDAQGNDLGIFWHGENAELTLRLMADYGKVIYLKAEDNRGLPVVGWKLTDREGNSTTVPGTLTDGIWALTVPQDTATIEPVYQTVDLTVQDESGSTLFTSRLHWVEDELNRAAQQVLTKIPGEEVLLGYVYGGNLYRTLAELPANVEPVTVTAKTLALWVSGQAELRHGATLTDSGPRFVATVGDGSVEKTLLLADSPEKLTVEQADYKVGNEFTEHFQEIISADGTVSYSIALTNIPAVDYNKTYYAAAAVRVTYADGTAGYVYTQSVSATVYQVARSTMLLSDARRAYTDGVLCLNAHGESMDACSYTVTLSYAENGNYVFHYTAQQKVEALNIAGKRYTAADGVVFGDGVITVPAGLFADALLQEELTYRKNALQIGAYKGPSVGVYQYTESDGTVTDYSVTRTHEQVYGDVEDFFQAGFNIWMAEDWIFGASHYGENDALSALDLAAEYCLNHGLTNEDIQVLVADSLLNGLLEGYTMPENAGSTVAEYANILAQRVDTLKNYRPRVNGVELGREYNCFAGFILRDEPHYDHLQYYTGWFSFLGADTDQQIRVTANGSAGKVSGTVNGLGLLRDGYMLYFSMMGMGAAQKYVVCGSTSEAPCTLEQYTEMLRTFVDGVNGTVWSYSNMLLAFDNYGLTSTASGTAGSTTVHYAENVNTGWQANLALVAGLVEEKNPNATFATALRSFGMTRLNKVASASKWYKTDSWTEYRAFDSAWGQQAVQLQAYTSLAHGYTHLSYFSYWEGQSQAYNGETFTDACVMWDGNGNPVKQEMYSWVKNTNEELRSMQALFGSFCYNGTGAVASGESYYGDTQGLWTAAQLAQNTAIASLSVSTDTTVGHYTKNSGSFGEMFVLVNMSHPASGQSDTVTVTFDGGYTGVIAYVNGEATIYSLTDGACTVTIPSGEGIILIPT